MINVYKIMYRTENSGRTLTENLTKIIVFSVSV